MTSFLETALNFTENLESWMTNLPEELRSISITNLAIPGSHDCGTFGITNDSQLAPDAEDLLQELEWLGPLLVFFMARWSITQSLNFTQQLHSGVRYFDLRIATKVDDDHFYYTHALYAGQVEETLLEFNAFLDDYPDEVVILDCQHQYAFEEEDYQKLADLFASSFGDKILPFTADMNGLSLNYLTSLNNYQVIIVYRTDALKDPSLFWPSDYFPNPWANTMSTTDLISFLDQGIRDRDLSRGFISQLILTPSGDYIVENLLSTLLEQCVIPLETDKYEWINRQQPGPGGVNIVMADFVDYPHFNFTRDVVALNQKLLRNYT